MSRQFCGQEHTRSLTFYIHNEQYMVVYKQGDEEQVVRVLEKWAADDELNFPMEAVLSVIGTLMRQ